MLSREFKIFILGILDLSLCYKFMYRTIDINDITIIKCYTIRRINHHCY